MISFPFPENALAQSAHRRPPQLEERQATEWVCVLVNVSNLHPLVTPPSLHSRRAVRGGGHRRRGRGRGRSADALVAAAAVDAALAVEGVAREGDLEGRQPRLDRVEEAALVEPQVAVVEDDRQYLMCREGGEGRGEEGKGKAQ